LIVRRKTPEQRFLLIRHTILPKTAVQENKDIIAQLEYFFPNESEVQLIAQTTSDKDALSYLRDLGIKNHPPKKRSVRLFLADTANDLFIDAYRVHDAMDTTGAGDAFAGGFLAGRLNGLTPYESAKLGHACAAIIVKEIGGHSHLWIQHPVRFAAAYQDADLVNALPNSAVKK
jgi:sugar/nucleoside kinase (ribokinase family)